MAPQIKSGSNLRATSARVLRDKMRNRRDRLASCVVKKSTAKPIALYKLNHLVRVREHFSINVFYIRNISRQIRLPPHQPFVPLYPIIFNRINLIYRPEMQILVKTLHGKQFKRDLDLNMTVQEFKEKIEKDEGKDYPIEHQKLIYEGKILANSSKLSEYNIDSKKFIVLLIARPPPPPKKEAGKATTSNKDKDQTQSKVKEEKETKTKDKDTKSSSRPTTRSSTASGAAASSTTQTSTSQSRNQTSTQSSSQQQSQPPPQQIFNTPPPLGSDNQMAARLASITSRPQFATIQQSIQQNPHLLSNIIESLASSEPEIYSFISENPDLFLNAVSAMPSPGSRVSGGGASIPSESGMPRMMTGSEPPSLNHMLPSATDHDRQAIERLKELGFTEFQAVQAYVACDKDEQLAANLLFQMEQ